MLYPAVVVYNDQTDTTIPYPGCFKVACPDVYGFKPSAVPNLPASQLIKNCVPSPWVRPSFAHPTDFFVPELGEGVWITFNMERYDLPVVHGWYPGADFQNMIDTANPNRDGISQAVSEQQTDRIIATRNGSYIKIEDTQEGLIVIEVYGATKNTEGDKSTRVGSKITLDPATDAQKIEMIAQNADGSSQTKLTLDVSNGAELIEALTPAGAQLLLDDANKLVQLLTESGYGIIIDEQSGTLDIEDSNGNAASASSSGWDITSATGSGIVISAGTQITLEGLGGNLKDIISNILASLTNIQTAGTITCAAPGAPALTPIWQTDLAAKTVPDTAKLPTILG